MGTWRGFSRFPSPVRGEAGLCSEAPPKFLAGLSPIGVFSDFDTHHTSPGAHMEFSRRLMECGYFRALFSKEDHWHLRHALLACNFPRVKMPLRGPGGVGRSWWEDGEELVGGPGGAGGRTARSWWEDGEELVGGRGAALPPVLGTLSTPPLLQPRHSLRPRRRGTQLVGSPHVCRRAGERQPCPPGRWGESRRGGDQSPARTGSSSSGLQGPLGDKGSPEAPDLSSPLPPLSDHQTSGRTQAAAAL